MHRCPGSAYLIVLVMLAACGSDASGPPGELTGTYELATINDDSLPAEWAEGDCRAEYQRMSMTFVSDRDLRIRLQARVDCNDGDWDVEIDSYAYGGDDHEYYFRSDTLSVYDDDGLMMRGPASSSTLQLTGGGAVFVFRK